MTTKRVLHWTLRAGLVLGLWAAVMLAMPFVGPDGRLIAVVGDPHQSVLAVLKAGGRIMAIRGRVVLTSSDRPDYPAALFPSASL